MTWWRTITQATMTPQTMMPRTTSPRRRRTRAAGSVLYDAPGPRTRRTTLVASVVAVAAIVAGAYVFVYLPLDRNGQLSAAKWGPMLDPADPRFELVWSRLGEGIANTLVAAALALVSSLVIGTLVAVLRLELQSLRERRYVGLPASAAVALRTLTWLLNAFTRFCVEIFRGLPVVITIFFVARGLPELGLNFDEIWFIVLGLTIYNGTVIAEVLRSGMSGLPNGQREAAATVGLSAFQTIRLVLLPQAYRIMLPALISQMVVVLKDTSLGLLIGYQDLLNIAQQVITVLNNPIQLYFLVGVLYVVANYALSKLAEYVQRRLARGRTAVLVPRGGGPGDGMPGAVPGAVTPAGTPAG